ncbi:MAG: glutaredoxin family protein [Finegoldia sp.]|nr:glutaredoxin family protein [Finegoldia sp.]
MKNLTVYTSNGCQYCHALKDYLDENKVEYTERNISEDMEARKELMQKGHMGVPVTVIDGETEIVGFDQEKIKEALGL